MHREDFPFLFNNITYLDNGATTLKPLSVVKKIEEYYTEYTANAHRGDYKTSLKVDTEYELARNKVQKFIGPKIYPIWTHMFFTTVTFNSLAATWFGIIRYRINDITGWTVAVSINI